ncbi:DUF6292 family protein [Actinosynnema sp. CA-299493]
MDLYFDDTMTHALRRYARSVSSAVGLSGDCWCVLGEHLAGIYLALDGRLASFPDHDVALLWDERHGWTAVVEVDEDMVVVERLAGLAVPTPVAVAEWVTGLFLRSTADTRQVGDRLPPVPDDGRSASRVPLNQVPAPRSPSSAEPRGAMTGRTT